MRRKLFPLILVLAAVTAAVWWVRGDHGPPHYTGFVEGEERVIRSEVPGRVLEVRFVEGTHVSPNDVIAVLDDRDIQARMASKRDELAVIDADIVTQTERVQLVESSWKRDVSSREADVRLSQSAYEVAERTLAREEGLVKTGASTAQQLDDSRGRRDQMRSTLDKAREMLAKTVAEERQITLARNELESMRRRHDLTQAQLDELAVALTKTVIRSPNVPTVVQTQFLWPGEFAQPGTAIVAVLDPKDKYVQIYVPVADVGRVRVGDGVAIELDSRPGHRVPGEISFVADKANFTPEKIETRSDRMGQVYRAKVRILEEVESFQPGTEGNVYLTTAR